MISRSQSCRAGFGFDAFEGSCNYGVTDPASFRYAATCLEASPMKIALTLLISLFATGLLPPALCQGAISRTDETGIGLTVMSFTVRWDGLDEGKNAWMNRRPVAVASTFV